MYFYEHIGHMQFSTLTLHTYLALQNCTKGKIGVFVSWDSVQAIIEGYGFSKRLSHGELDRFCYGFECIDRYINGKREIALTETGTSFLQCLLNEAPRQSSQIAFLARKAKKKGSYNVTVQETTFFDPKIYGLIKEYGFRSGGARDFIKCMSVGDLMEFLARAFNRLAISDDKEGQFTLEDCIAQVQKSGKYWASVGGKYSWYVYPQRFNLDFDGEDFACYDEVQKALIRPPEWGGGKDCPYPDFLRLVKSEERFVRFRKAGIIRPVWNSSNIKQSHLRMTSPGYLMWERRKKGFIFEYLVRRISDKHYQFGLCNASDFPKDVILVNDMTLTGGLPSYEMKGESREISKVISRLLNEQDSLFKHL